jgi:hypothetical protein
MFTNQQAALPMIDGLAITEQAQCAADALRAVNYLAAEPQRALSLTYPQDISSVVTELYAATQRLGQAFKDVDAALASAAATGRIRGLDDAELGDRPLAALDCGRHVAVLESALRRARDYTGGLSYDVAQDWSA